MYLNRVVTHVLDSYRTPRSGALRVPCDAQFESVAAQLDLRGYRRYGTRTVLALARFKLALLGASKGEVRYSVER